MRALLITAVFRKSLVLAPAAFRQISVGKIVNQVSSEAGWMLLVTPGLMNLVVAPFMVRRSVEGRIVMMVGAEGR